MADPRYYDPKDCPTCAGRGYIDEKPCPVCEETGVVANSSDRADTEDQDREDFINDIDLLVFQLDQLKNKCWDIRMKDFKEEARAKLQLFLDAMVMPAPEEPCPECKENLPAESDYLCAGCRASA